MRHAAIDAELRAIGADDHRPLGRQCVKPARAGGQHLAVDRGVQPQEAVGLDAGVDQLEVGRQQRRNRIVSQFLDIATRIHQRVELVAQAKGVIETAERQTEAGRAAFHNRLLEQSFGLGAGKQQRNVLRARGLAEYRHVAGIAAECGNVRLHPFECGDLVHQAVITRRPALLLRQPAMRQKAEHAEPILDRHQHHALVGNARLDSPSAAACIITTAMNPNHHRALTRQRRRADVERQTILPGIAVIMRVPLIVVLDARRRLMRGIADALPRHHRLRRAPAILAGRRCRKGNALEDQRLDILAGSSLDHAAGYIDDRWRHGN